MAQGLISEGEPLDIGSDLFRQRLDEVIDQKLLASEALKQKLDKDPVAQRRLAAARERVLGDMLVESVVEKAVNENAIRGLYAEQQKLSKRSGGDPRPPDPGAPARPTPRPSRSC